MDKMVFSTTQATQNPQTERGHAPRSSSLGLSLSTAFICLLISAPAFAAGNPIQEMLDGVISFLNTGVMRGVAILSVIGLGVSAYFGRLSWQKAAMACGGIILTFGAASLVDQFSGYVS